ncbi:MAG: hypothetical protein JEY94_09840 [Melioribacteraceae bacterium]|nr:hypothetical protein [Melioribacteraceae bacterium]
MNQTKVSCKDVMSHICDNLGEDMDSPRCKAIKEHLDNCDGCQNYFSSVNGTIGLYKEYNAKLSKEGHSKLFDCLGLSEFDVDSIDSKEKDS